MTEAKTPEELDRAADTARKIADRAVGMFLKVIESNLSPTNPRLVVIRETIQGAAADVLLYG